MLNVMRKHAYSWLVRVILFLIVVVFAFWGLGGGRFFEQVHPVATFNGQEIMASEVDQEAGNQQHGLPLSTRNATTPPDGITDQSRGLELPPELREVVPPPVLHGGGRRLGPAHGVRRSRQVLLGTRLGVVVALPANRIN